MIKETITYIDYNEVERTEDFYFNLNKAELVEWELGKDGGLVEMINKIIAAKDMPALIKLFKELVLKAYGVKSLDGKRFEKSEELSTAFAQTAAYPDLFMKLAMDADAAARFVNGIMPKDMQQNIQKSLN